MTKISINLADTDKSYIDAFSKYVLSKYSDRFDLSTFADEEVLKKVLENKNQDIFLIEENILQNNLDICEGLNVVCLSQNKQPADINGYKAISKYQNVENILSEIISLSNNNINSFICDNKNSTKIISLFSPIGGSGKTTVASSLALKFSRLSKKVLYINMESVPSTDYIFNGESDKTISNLLYGVLKGQSISARIEGTKVIDINSGIFYFKPQHNSLELLELSSENYISIISAIKELNLYDYVIFDLPPNITNQNYSILNNSDIILTPLIDDGISETRIIFYFNQLKSHKLEEILKNTILVLNKSDSIPEWFDNFSESNKSFSIPFIHERKMIDVSRLMTKYLDVLYEKELLRE